MPNYLIKPYAVKQAMELLKGIEVAVGCANLVKTSTGYGYVKLPGGEYNYRGATVADVELMRKHSWPKVKVKCAGGVRTLDDMLKMKAVGATRCGATATEAILNEAEKRFGTK